MTVALICAIVALILCFLAVVRPKVWNSVPVILFFFILSTIITGGPTFHPPH